MRIAIVKLSALGDIVHAMVVLQFIKSLNTSIVIDWIVEEDYKELLSHQPDINKIYAVSIRKAKKNNSIFLVVRELIKLRKLESYDLIIDMQGLIKSALITWFIPSTRKIGFDKNSIRERVMHPFYIKKNIKLIMQKI